MQLEYTNRQLLEQLTLQGYRIEVIERSTDYYVVFHSRHSTACKQSITYSKDWGR